MSAVPGLPAEYFMMLWAGVAVFWVFLILYAFLKNRGKIQIRIKGTIPEMTVWKKPDPLTNEVEMRKAKGKGGTGWRFKFDKTCLIMRRSYGRTFFVLEIWPEAAYAVSQMPDLETKDQPQWDKKAEEKLFEANVIKAAGATTQKLQTPMLLYILPLIAIVLIIIQILLSQGKVRIG